MRNDKIGVFRVCYNTVPEYVGYVDRDGNARVKIELTVSEEEKQYTWDQLRRSRHVADCYISVEPTELFTEPILNPDK